MNGMRNNGNRLGALLALLLLACGGDGAKDEFAAYERSVEPVLAAEADLRARFDEKMKDAMAYRAEEGVKTLLVDRMAPFYADMEKKAGAIAPPGEKLAAVHAVLLRYVTLRREFLAGYIAQLRQADAIGGATAEARQKVDQAWTEVEAAADALNHAAESAGEAALALAPVFRQEAAANSNLQAAIDALLIGRLPPDTLTAVLEKQFRPAYAAFRKQVDGFDVAQGGMEMVIAAKAYLAKVEGVMGQALALAAVVKESGPAVAAPSDDDLARLWQEAEDTRRIYQEDAKSYRESLK